MGLFTITTNAYENQPPNQVGNNQKTINYGNDLTFTIADFTTDTTPVYQDPEGDAASQLKILTLPTTGTLKYNNTAVTLNQVINFSDINNGLLVFSPDTTNTSTHSVNFDFAIADSGSGIFTE